MLRAGNHVNDIERAAEAIARATALLITAGAGMGVDSGLPDFRGDEGFWKAYPPFREKGLRFVDLANPRLVRARPGARLGLLRSPARALPTDGASPRLPHPPPTRRAVGPLLRLHLERRRPVPARRLPRGLDRRVPRLDPPPAVPRRLRHRHLSRRRRGDGGPRRASAPARRSPAARNAGLSPGPTSSCSGTGAGTSRAAVSRSGASSSSWTRPPGARA